MTEDPLPLAERCRRSAPSYRGRSLLDQAPAASAIEACLSLQPPPVQPVSGEAPTEFLQTDARSWYLGAQGELIVARSLARLGDDWLTLHAVPIGTRNSDIDHVVVGRAGVFTINAKHHPGAKVWVSEGRLLVNGAKTDHLRNSRFEASRTTRLLTEEAVQHTPVHAVIALVGVESVTFKQQPSGVTVLQEQDLIAWLLSRPAIWSDAMTEYVARALCDSALWAPEWAPVPPELISRFNALAMPTSLGAGAVKSRTAPRSTRSSASRPRSGRPGGRAERRRRRRRSALIEFATRIAIMGVGLWVLLGFIRGLSA